VAENLAAVKDGLGFAAPVLSLKHKNVAWLHDRHLFQYSLLALRLVPQLIDRKLHLTLIRTNSVWPSLIDGLSKHFWLQDLS
jgi:hypothetical protein